MPNYQFILFSFLPHFLAYKMMNYVSIRILRSHSLRLRHYLKGTQYIRKLRLRQAINMRNDPI